MHSKEMFLALATSLILFMLFCFQPLSTMAAAQSPLQLIQSGSDRGMRIIKSSLFEGGPSLQQRRDEILVIVDEYFDFNEMAKRALGKSWKEVPGEKRQEFVKLFKQLLFNTYVRRIETTAKPTTTTQYDSETIEDRYAVVKTRVVGTSQQDVAIEYRLFSNAAGWKVYDVVIEGVSLVNNYRQQFSSILNRESFDSLLQQLREKVATQAGS